MVINYEAALVKQASITNGYADKLFAIEPGGEYEGDNTPRMQILEGSIARVRHVQDPYWVDKSLRLNRQFPEQIDTRVPIQGSRIRGELTYSQSSDTQFHVHLGNVDIRIDRVDDRFSFHVERSGQDSVDIQANGVVQVSNRREERKGQLALLEDANVALRILVSQTSWSSTPQINGVISFKEAQRLGLALNN